MLRGIHVLYMSCYSLSVKVPNRTVMSQNQKKLFQRRVCAHFEKTAKTVEPFLHHQLKETLQSSDGFIVSTHEDVNVQEKLGFIQKFIKKVSKTKDPLIKSELIKNLDIECFSILDYLEPARILGLMNRLVRIMPTKIVSTYFYEKSIPLLIQAAKKGRLRDREKIQLLYYISLSSAKGAPFVKQLQFYLPAMEELPLIEKIICASSYYRTSVPWPLRQSRVFQEISESECQELVEDKNCFFSLCNTVQTIKPGKAWVNELTKAMMKSSLDFQTAAHLLSVYARTLIYEPSLVDKIVVSALSNLDQKQKNSVNIKDLDILLWSMSYLGFILKQPEKNLLSNALRERFNVYKKNSNLPLLVSSLLSLHMLRCWNYEIVDYCLREGLINKVFKRDFWKHKTRLQLLISQIIIESKLKVPESLQEPVRVGYAPSNNIKRLFNIGLSLVEKKSASAAAIDFPINSLIIPGITVHSKFGKYHFDILDESTCLAGTNIPHGLMGLKIRLVTLKGFRHLMITPDMLDDRVMGTSDYMEKMMKDYAVYGSTTTHFAVRAFAI